MDMDRVEQLGYIGLEVSDELAWDDFATDILGLMPNGRDDTGARRFRIDANDHRVSLQQGPRDDIAHAGWQVADPGAAERVAERLQQLGAPVRQASPTEAERRRVTGLFRAEDPDGLVHEIYWGAHTTTPTPFCSPRGFGQFEADQLGLGHIVLSVRDYDASLRFFRDGLGLRISDFIALDTGGAAPTTVAFLHCGPRHHSLAIVPLPSSKLLHHLMLEACDLDDVGRTFDLCRDRGVPITADLGRHTNDQMTSFYAVTPSGFQVEYGYGGRTIDDATWEVETYATASIWGHRTPATV